MVERFNSYSVPNRSETRERDWERHVVTNLMEMDDKSKETVWPRDTLFDFFCIMETLQENLGERAYILQLIKMTMIDLAGVDKTQFIEIFALELNLIKDHCAPSKIPISSEISRLIYLREDGGCMKLSGVLLKDASLFMYM